MPSNKASGCGGKMNFGTTELLIILAIILLLFGAKKLPELSKSLGQSMKELRKGLNDSSDDEKSEKADKKTSKK
jgi:sec-independent protein translocase protein TatA